jgi:molybdopterin converting factor subunit 1
MTAPVTITVAYYARLREQARTSEETVQTSAARVDALYEEISRRHGFDFPRDRLKVAVNEHMCDWDAELKDGDSVAFLPPVAGG